MLIHEVLLYISIGAVSFLGVAYTTNKLQEYLQKKN